MKLSFASVFGYDKANSSASDKKEEKRGDHIANKENDLQAALAQMEGDPDIVAEAMPLALDTPIPIQRPIIPRDHVPLNVVNSAHRANESTAALLKHAGGLETLRSFTNAFYEKAFNDPHIDQFIRNHDDPHGERFALWIAEKMGHGRPWTQERSTRPMCPFNVPGVGGEELFIPPYPTTVMSKSLSRSEVAHTLECTCTLQAFMFTTARALTSRPGTRQSVRLRQKVSSVALGVLH